MQADNDDNTTPEQPPTASRAVRRRSVPRLVTTASLTSHVHVLAGPGGRPRPAYVLLPGIGIPHHHYTNLQALLSEHANCLTIDLPGFGQAPAPEHQLNAAQYASHAAAVLAKMGVNSAIVVGHSRGGAEIAAELAAQKPDLITHLVLLGPVGEDERPPTFRQITALGLRALRKDLPKAPGQSGRAEHLMRRYRSTSPLAMPYDLQSRLALVNQPVLVIRGTREITTPRTWCQKLIATAPNGRLLELPGAGHLTRTGAAGAAVGTRAFSTSN
ncbi:MULTISPECIES: alpha/beta fold hydrolase [unclassified Pseudarthrobacter]|uniref:alpha/beta fold hydrolase n=1 Tax=unclassified Pseudarthrobacter TaxID=2647000 RepID=UPI00362C2938